MAEKVNIATDTTLKEVLSALKAQNELWAKIAGPKSGIWPKKTIAYQSEVSLDANTTTEIGTLSGKLTITLNSGYAGFDNEWDAVISMGSTEYDVVLPSVRWGLHTLPSFSANTATVIRLFYIGSVLCGEWTVI